MRANYKAKAAKRPFCPICAAVMPLTAIVPIIFPRGPYDQRLTFTCESCRIQSNQVMATIIEADRR
jgi:hypothetical protein